MHDLMVGMFWGGLVMALPPILVGVAIVMLLISQHKAAHKADGSDRGAGQ